MKNVYLTTLIFALLVGFMSCQEESKAAIEDSVETAKTPTEQNENSPSVDKKVDPATDDLQVDVVNPDFEGSENTLGMEDSPVRMDEEMPPPPVEELIVTENRLEKVEDAYDFHKYVKLNAFLQKYVTYAGNVKYSSIKSNKSELTAITKELEDNFPGSGWSSTQKLTYWINAYNVYTIQLIVDNYPTTSITKITAKPWHKKFIKLNGATYSLNQIENDIVRKKFNEPRVHFALNCGSKSCPVLLNKAYTPAKLYGQLTSQTKRFLSDTSKNQFTEKSIEISSIFDWYSEDFNKGGKTTIDFFNKYRTEQLKDPKVTYMTYSWDLNK
ncbi:MAG: hypothetical protein ACI837_000973 [Crocinitomicaceae bacterium]|jgi:hypothetical protein